MLREVWRRALTVQEPPDTHVVGLLAVTALLLVVIRPLWPLTRMAVTITHEGAHALAAVLTGRRLRGIKLHADTSGLTLSAGKPRGPGMVVTLLAGYLGPALFGVGAALLLGTGRSVGLLWLVVLVLGLMLLQIRNLYGLLVLVVAGAAVVAVSWYLTPVQQGWIAYLLTWLLLFAAPRPVLELAGDRRRGRAKDSDADQLARLTGVPGAVWTGFFGLVTIAGCAVGIWLLLPAESWLSPLAEWLGLSGD